MKTKIQVQAIACAYRRAKAKALSADGRYFMWEEREGWVEITKYINNVSGRFKQACDIKGRKIIRGRIFIEVDQ